MFKRLGRMFGKKDPSQRMARELLSLVQKVQEEERQAHRKNHLELGKEAEEQLKKEEKLEIDEEKLLALIDQVSPTFVRDILRQCLSSEDFSLMRYVLKKVEKGLAVSEDEIYARYEDQLRKLLKEKGDADLPRMRELCQRLGKDYRSFEKMEELFHRLEHIQREEYPFLSLSAEDKKLFDQQLSLVKEKGGALLPQEFGQTSEVTYQEMEQLLELLSHLSHDDRLYREWKKSKESMRERMKEEIKSEMALLLSPKKR